MILHLTAVLMCVSGLEGVVNNINLEINIDGNGISGEGIPRIEAEIPRPTQSATPSDDDPELSDGDGEQVAGGVAKEMYYESLQEPLIESEVLVPIEREELPIPLKELSDDVQSLVAVEAAVEERNTRHQRGRKAADWQSSAAEFRSTRNAGRCHGRRAYSMPPDHGNRKVYDECPSREPNFDLSWMTCDADIKDWAYKKDPASIRTQLHEDVRVAPSPSFKNIMDDFWQEQTGAGFLAMFNEVRSSHENKKKKRDTCSKKQVGTAIQTKWDSMKDKVLEVRRDIRMRMIRAAEAGQLSKSGLLILRDEQLISEALLMGVNQTGSS